MWVIMLYICVCVHICIYKDTAKQTLVRDNTESYLDVHELAHFCAQLGF